LNLISPFVSFFPISPDSGRIEIIEIQ